MSEQTKTVENKSEYWKKRECGVIWKWESKTSGQKYLRIKLEIEDELGCPQIYYMKAFRNKFKDTQDNPNRPDFRIFLDEDSEQQAQKDKKKNIERVKNLKNFKEPVGNIKTEKSEEKENAVAAAEEDDASF